MSKKASTFREEMNCEMFTNLGGMEDSIPKGSGELTPDKPYKKDMRWDKISGLHDGGTVDEAGNSDPLWTRGCWSYRTYNKLLRESMRTTSVFKRLNTESKSGRK
jgi:hypothetical protein